MEGNTAYTWSFDAMNDGGAAASYSVYCRSSAAGHRPEHFVHRPAQRLDLGADRGSLRHAARLHLRERVHAARLGRGGDPLPGASQLEAGTTFTSYSRTRDFPIASDISGGSWCVQGTWTPENGAPWRARCAPPTTASSRPSRATTAIVLPVLCLVERSHLGRFRRGPALEAARPPAELDDRFDAHRRWRLRPRGHHALRGRRIGGDALREVSGGVPRTGVMDAQKAKLGLTPLAGDSASQPFGGFASDVKVFRRAACQ